MAAGPAAWDDYDDPFDFFEYEDDEEEEEGGADEDGEEEGGCGHSHGDGGHSHSHGDHHHACAGSTAAPAAASETQDKGPHVPPGAAPSVRRVVRRGVLGSGQGIEGRVVVTQAVVERGRQS